MEQFVESNERSHSQQPLGKIKISDKTKKSMENNKNNSTKLGGTKSFFSSS